MSEETVDEGLVDKLERYSSGVVYTTSTLQYWNKIIQIVRTHDEARLMEDIKKYSLVSKNGEWYYKADIDRAIREVMK